MFDLDLTNITIQGIARLHDKKLIIGNCAPFSEVNFEGCGAYIRDLGNETASKSTALECDEYLYNISTEYAFVYFDFINQYTLDSVRATVLSQLNQKHITIEKITSDFDVIKKEENLKIKDACMLKITFKSNTEFINDCDGLICQC